jgi:hypothetical protein
MNMKRIIITAKRPAFDTISQLFNNVEIILQNKQVILNNPNFYNICIDGISIGSAYTGEIQIPLGVLVQLWDSTPWCAANQYTYHIGGSPLSGLCIEYYWDAETKSFCEKKGRNFMSLARPAFRTINNENNIKADYPVRVPNVNKPERVLELKDVLDCIAANKIR